MRTLAEQALRETAVVSDDVVGTIKAIIAEIDKNLTDQINVILHNERFQQVESAWRGLQSRQQYRNGRDAEDPRHEHLQEGAGQDAEEVQGRLLGPRSRCSRSSTSRNTASSAASRTARWWGDYYFDHTPGDVELLGQMAQIAAASHAPFIAGGSPSLMGMDSWQELANPRDLAKIFAAPDYAAWRSLRESDDAKYVGLAMPRFLARLPYGARSNPVEEIRVRRRDRRRRSQPLHTWANAGYAMAVNIKPFVQELRLVLLDPWCRIGGAVEGLPVHTFPSDDGGGVDMKCPTEIAISDRREAELAAAASCR